MTERLGVFLYLQSLILDGCEYLVVVNDEQLCHRVHLGEINDVKGERSTSEEEGPNHHNQSIQGSVSHVLALLLASTLSPSLRHS